LSLVGRWKKRYEQAIIIIDQFEELFTLCPLEVQSRFAELLGRMVLEADAQVLLSMRDDFLSHCTQPALAPLFSELTPLHPLTDAALRRALVQPALKCGYRFEEESLVEEMIAEVSEERGALPLLAFAAAQLWERRDRKQGLLTRESYEVIGGVGGALAQHAEATLEKIGHHRLPVVRELFRNLVTAQGTRAVHDIDELLSVFEDQEAAGEVLRELIDARLITSFEVTAGEEEEKSRQRVEIIHESLLSAWPRLVRWRMQDVEGAKLRDELRQSAQMWEEHNRSEDRIWTGTAFREYQLWRERYSGGLTKTEEAFAQAMVERANRQRRRKRLAIASAFTFLLGVVAVVGVSRQQAVWQARRAQASQLVALGRVEIDRYPTATLAYAGKSLEVADNLEARRLAVEALWGGPTARILPLGINTNSWSAEFSPDGRWLASYTFSENVLLFPDNGGPPRVIGGHTPPTNPPEIAFAPGGNALLTRKSPEPIRMVSVPDGQAIGLLAPEPFGGGPIKRWFWEASLPQGILFSVFEGDDLNVYRHEILPYEGGPPQIVGAIRTPRSWFADNGGSQIALRRGERILVRPLAGPIATPEREIATVAEGSDTRLVFHPRGDWLAVGEDSGRLALWPLDPDAPREARVFQVEGPDIQFTPAFDARGSRLVWGSQSAVSLWYLDGPPDAEPVILRRPDVLANKRGVFHPNGDWLVVAGDITLTFWAVGQPQSFVLHRSAERVFQVDFTPNSNTLLACTDKGVQVKPIHPQAQTVHTLAPELRQWCHQVVVSPDGQHFLCGQSGGNLYLSSISEGAGQWLLRKATGQLFACTFDASGRRVAGGIYYSGDSSDSKVVRVWDLETDAVQSLPLVPSGDTVEGGYDWGVNSLGFESEKSLLAAGSGGVRRFDIETGKSEWIWKLDKGMHASMALSSDARRLLATALPWDPDREEDHPVVLFDLAEGREKPITSHGNRVKAVALDREGQIMVTGDAQGVIRAGLADGSEPHLLFGHSGGQFPPNGLAVSPDGRWIASTDQTEIRLWPMPDLTKPPLHTMPLDQLLAKLIELTNLEVIEDETSPTGYRLEIGPFPGWETMPEW
jgi:WD40 repeat protein